MFKINIFKNTSLSLVVALAIGFLFASTGSSLADSSTLGDVFCNVFTNAKPFGKMFQWVAYVAGAVFTLQGVSNFRKSNENPQHSLNHAIMLWFGAMCLLALPGFVSTVIGSLGYTSQGAGGALSCGGGISGGGAATLDTMLANFIGNIKSPMLSIISLTAILCGLFMIVRGLMKASKYGFDPKTHSINSILSNIVFGALLMSVGDNLNMMLSSVFGSGTTMSSAAIDPSGSSVLSWGFVSSLGGGSQQFATAVAAGLSFVQLIGAISFVRGWLIMKKVVEGGGNVTMAQGLTHIIGGTMAINIAAFIQILDATLGTGLIGP